MVVGEGVSYMEILEARIKFPISGLKRVIPLLLYLFFFLSANQRFSISKIQIKPQSCGWLVGWLVGALSLVNYL